MSDLREWLAYLAEIGVDELRAPTRPVVPVPSRPVARAEPVPPPPAEPARPTVRQRGMDFGTKAGADPAARLREIRERIGDCTRCRLHELRKNIVFGVGDPRAKLMIVGEGPGAEEDERGEPFVGKAGRKLDEMIKAIGFSREQVYIANIVKCRPPGNRDPETDEIATCAPFLVEQIEAIRPRVIIALGAPATRTLLRTNVGITKLRGQWHEFQGIPVMPTFHPAYLLRSYTLENRRLVWADFQAARDRVLQDA